jgi:hypothetical protein
MKLVILLVISWKPVASTHEVIYQAPAYAYLE